MKIFYTCSIQKKPTNYLHTVEKELIIRLNLFRRMEKALRCPGVPYTVCLKKN